MRIGEGEDGAVVQDVNSGGVLWAALAVQLVANDLNIFRDSRRLGVVRLSRLGVVRLLMMVMAGAGGSSHCNSSEKTGNEILHDEVLTD